MTPQERAAYIKEEFRKLDIRQCQLAKSLGVSDAAVNRVINGNRGSAHIARAIAEAIGRPFERLFPETAEREKIKAEFKPVEKPVRIPVDLVALDRLRKDVKKLMIELDLDVRKKGALALWAAAVTARLEKNVSRPILSMALSGYRATSASLAILEALRDILNEKLSTAA